jgi:thiamine-phosphate pyrophosphorylase
MIQYREKNKSTKEMYDEAIELRSLCKNTVFLINDRVDIALAVKADGVHIGQEDLPYSVARKILGKKKVIGLTVHSLKEAIKAQNSGADYISVSPIFKTSTKHDAGVTVGVNLIRKIKKSVSIPVVAIGGIDLLNSPEVIRAGADALCAISAVVAKPQVRVEIQRFQELFL